ncbi:MAG TPA: NAD(P)-dependent oxidoreductase [Stellaceae bacterium]|nr:NAD(P)-dependent oxidoreductase [Stellaceae bacterium]
MPKPAPILLTGAAGALGQCLRPHLAKRPEGLRSSDIRDPGAPLASEEFMLGDVGDAAFVDRLVEGTSAIVHMGAVATEDAIEKIWHANFHGTFHVFNAARRHGVKRVVFASSNHAIGFHRTSDRLDSTVAQRPDTMYGVSKAFGEDLGSLMADKFGLEVVCLRIGSAVPQPREPRHLSTWLSYPDLVRLVEACLAAPKVHFDIVYGVSNNRRSRWDNSKSGIDYRPQDDAERFAAKIIPDGDKRDPADPTVVYHGGPYISLGLGEKPKS